MYFNKDSSIESNGEQADMKQDPDEEDIVDVKLDNERDCH